MLIYDGSKRWHFPLAPFEKTPTQKRNSKAGHVHANKKQSIAACGTYSARATSLSQAQSQAADRTTARLSQASLSMDSALRLQVPPSPASDAQCFFFQN